MPLVAAPAVISRDPQDDSRLRVADINRWAVVNSLEFTAHAPDRAESHPNLARALPHLPDNYAIDSLLDKSLPRHPREAPNC
ncbi:hypothetical protein OG245_36055 [Streptomyces sp. NBC_01116]|uniref:hypothetical protein n=1 Tax=Streptomyces sp. NBC_01116 TaxID=2903752 RepID=UPI00324796D7